MLPGEGDILREIVELGAPLLRVRAAEVLEPHSREIAELIADMQEVLEASHGVGLAAPQVGVSLRVIIVASRPNARYPHAPLMEPTPMINPVLEWAAPESVKDWEGCLSIPGLRARVPRAAAVRVRYFDHRTGTQLSAEYQGFVARVWQHEYDHLEGIVFPDRVESSLDFVTDREYQRILRESGVTGTPGHNSR